MSRWVLGGGTVALLVALLATFAPPFTKPREVIVTGDKGYERRVALPSERLLIAVTGPLGETRVEVCGYRARVLSSPCPNKICVNRGWLSRRGESAACVPNRVLVYMR